MKIYKLSSFFIFVTLFSIQLPLAQTHNWERSNPGGGGAFSTVGASASGIIIAGSDLSGAYRSRDGGFSWDVIGVNKGLTETHVSGVGFHRIDGDILYIGTEYGIFRSSNGGNSVSRVLEGGYITDIEFGTDNLNTGYASYHPEYNSDEGVVYKSVDNGLNWSQTSTNLPSNGIRILKIVVNPDDVNIVYILTGQGRFACGEADVYRSTDGGVMWTNLTSSLPSILDFSIDSNNPNNVFITTMNADCDEGFYWIDLDGDFYKSTNGGTSWANPIANGRTGVIWIDTDNSNLIRLIEPRQAYTWIDDAGTWTSINGGNTFTHTGFVDDWDTFYNGDPFYCYGPSFNGLSKTIGEDLSNTENYFWINSQWIFITDDGGNTFENLMTYEVSPSFWQSTGFDNVNMADISISKADPDIIYLAYFDIGIWRSLDHGISWQSCNDFEASGNWDGRGGNSATVLADPDRANVVWASLSQNQNGEDPTFLLKNTNTGDKDSWENISSDLILNDILGLSLDVNSPSNNRTLYVTSAGDVYKSTNDGNNWSMVFNCNGCQFTAVDKFDENLIYAGGNTGLWRSTDSSGSWTNISHPDMPSTSATTIWDGTDYDGVFDVKIDPNNPNWVYVTVLGSEKGLYKSTNRGDNWIKILTDEFMRKVAIMPQNSDIIYATSSSAFEAGGYDPNSKGILFSSDGGENWTQQNQGMAYPFAMAIAIDNRANPDVFVGSPGTGFQWSPVDLSSVAIKDVAAFFVKMQLYPNPTKGKLHLTVSKNTKGQLIISDLVGKILHQQNIKQQHTDIHVDALTNGVYLFSFQMDDGFSITKKVVLNR